MIGGAQIVDARSKRLTKTDDPVDNLGHKKEMPAIDLDRERTQSLERDVICS